MMALEVCWGACGKVESLSTNSAKSFDGSVATFDASENFLQFGGPEELPPGASIKAIIKEKGMARDEPEHWLKRVGEGLAAGVMLAEEAAHHRRSWGLPKAHTEPLPLEVLRRSEDFVELDLPISRTAGGGVPCAMGCFRASEAGDFVRLQVRWLSFRKLKQMWVGSEDLGGSNSLKPPLVELRHRDPKTVYEPIGVEQVLKMERAERIIETWRRYYEGDPVYDHLGTSLPSCKRVRAVHGVNRATEKAFALRVNTVRLKKSQMLTRLTLDDEAMVSDSGLSIKGGIVYFNGSDAELSGDGVVNAASMNVCQQWAKSGVDVGVTFLPGVEHRAMLADSFFHQAIKQVVLTPEEKAQPGASFSIAGSFNEWSSEVMTWDGTCFVYVVRIGAGGSESFHVLADGSCEAVLYPSVKDANPKVHHTVQGPDRKPPPGFLWTIASKIILKDGLPQGTGIKVKLEVNDAGAAQRVLWDPFVPLQPVRDGAWQVEAGGTWMDFPASAHSQLCAARAKLKPETTIEMNGRRYKIDFLNMLQTNLATKKQMPPALFALAVPFALFALSSPLWLATWRFGALHFGRAQQRLWRQKRLSGRARRRARLAPKVLPHAALGGAGGFRFRSSERPAAGGGAGVRRRCASAAQGDRQPDDTEVWRRAVAQLPQSLAQRAAARAQRAAVMLSWQPPPPPVRSPAPSARAAPARTPPQPGEPSPKTVPIFYPPEMRGPYTGRELPDGLKVYIATPAYGGQVTVDYMTSVINMVTQLKEVAWQLSLVAGQSIITVGRNNAVMEFLATDCTHLLFLDADVAFSVDTIRKMLGEDRDVILAPYPAKSLNEERMQESAMRRGGPARLADGLHYVLHAQPAQVQAALAQGSSLVEVDAGPTGCMLIKRQVFQRLMEAYPEMHCRITGSHAGKAQCYDVWWRFFDTAVENGEFLGEDIAFCRRWRNIGGQIWADLGAKMTHVGRYAYTGNMLEASPMGDR
ncbi:unnamed protein product [Effrenium voratum]|uniref:WWE domain-containing protein n=1 Tax=Effrenium voratum TaxID=2562239 RepID=A0AA36I1Z0_9DINO|nr:unnamed protein product [Effrenium voratum]